MSLLAGASSDDLETVRDKFFPCIEYTYITRPETGMVMVRAKADGSKARFNLGEVIVSRCVLEVGKTHMGVAWILGSDLRHAELAALFDGLLQNPDFHEKLKVPLLEKLRAKQSAKNRDVAKNVAGTMVEFFTLKRGE